MYIFIYIYIYISICTCVYMNLYRFAFAIAYCETFAHVSESNGASPWGPKSTAMAQVMP